MFKKSIFFVLTLITMCASAGEELALVTVAESHRNDFLEANITYQGEFVRVDPTARTKSVQIQWFQNKSDDEATVTKKSGEQLIGSITLNNLKTKNEPLYNLISPIKTAILKRLPLVGQIGTVTDKQPDDYKQYQQIFRDAMAMKLGASWTVTPEISEIDITPEEIFLEYPENASVIDLKKEVYDIFKLRYPDNSIIKDRLYNIVIYLSRNQSYLLLDNDKMHDIDAIKDPAVSYTLKLTKSKLETDYITSEYNEQIIMDYYYPPCISIDGNPVVRALTLRLLAEDKGIAITLLRLGVTDDREPVIMPTNGTVNAIPFQTLFNNALMYQSREPVLFFKQALAVWAYAKNKKVTFQCKPLKGSIHEGGVTVNMTIPQPPQLTKKNPSGGVSRWQRFKSFIQQNWSPTKNYILGLLGLGVVGSAAYYASRNQPVGWWATWFKPTPQSKSAVVVPSMKK